jgi:hypothetical protein
MRQLSATGRPALSQLGVRRQRPTLLKLQPGETP